MDNLVEIVKAISGIVVAVAPIYILYKKERTPTKRRSHNR
jgi:hypothetical protein